MNAREFELDHFKIYVVANIRVDYRIQLKGQFDEEPENTELMALSYFANPVGKNSEHIFDENAHLTWYRLYQQIPEPLRSVTIQNQFDSRPQKIMIGNAAGLLVPAQKRRRGGRFPEKLGHYKLYRILEGKPAGKKSVKLQDQFGFDEVKVYYPAFFGVPVVKEYREDVSPIYNKETHLVIYAITPRPYQIARPVRDQFGIRFLYFLRSVGLAVPSLKLEWEEVEGYE